jgi:ABC-2 type transport system ATP-binding protein/lipopolysaccharide transport system ATP-binding protein
MNPENLIEVRDVSMRYRVHKSRRRSLRESIFRSVLRRDEVIDVWALKEVSFSVARGDALGVIGDNGSGKSTLCLLISRIMTPTSGKVEVVGKVSALLSLGAGFQPDLTGRDNIFLNGIYLGYKRDEIQAKFKEIVDFAELWDFIDVPLRTYSSGMRARLAFSIAASIRPEVLVIDELMGVGDIRFRQKSTARMKEMISESQGLVVVSHSMQTIRSICSRVVWLDKGQMVADGPVEEVVSKYETR